MEQTATPPAPKAFRVYAVTTFRMYQDVAAATPAEAYRLARENTGGWRYCFEPEQDDYAISPEIEDEATGEFLSVRDSVLCRTCGSEIVASINDSIFGDGECGPCEYARYRQTLGRDHSGPARAADVDGVS